jgi:adenine-specific DNA methylase
MSTRLIETWLPIVELGIESVRERTLMTPFPAPNRLHVWWTRRPLVASRAAVLASRCCQGMSITSGFYGC